MSARSPIESLQTVHLDPMHKPVFDNKVIYDLAKIHCTHEEICTITGINSATLSEKFGALIRKGYDEGKRSLRRMQWLAAEQGNVTMLIWLGKQLLGQREKFPDEATNIVFNVAIKESP